MATKYEYYEPSINSIQGFFGTAVRCQTFTPSVAHTITSVFLKLNRTTGTANTLNISIRATSEGQPTGSDLATASIASSSVSGYMNSYELVLNIGVALSVSVQYAIYMSQTGDASNYLEVGILNGEASYTGGQWGESSNGGSTWSMKSGDDAWFQEWGNPSTNIKTIGGLPIASVKTLGGLAIASVKSIGGLE